MSELRQALDDIKNKLSNSRFQNEEHVRLSLVARILHLLGWDIWNPSEVNTEFVTAPDEDRTKVDVALFAYPNYPSVLIEVKAVGKMVGTNVLSGIELQMRNYNRDITAPFSIITDGREWRFYYVKGEGTFSQKLFQKLDLISDNAFHLEQKLEVSLSRGEIVNGNAEKIAKQKLRVTQKQVVMSESLSEAELRTKREPYPSLPTAVKEVVAEKGIEISIEEAVAFLRALDNENPTPVYIPYTPSLTQSAEQTTGLEPLIPTHSYAQKRLKRMQFNGKIVNIRSWAELKLEVSSSLASNHNDFERVLDL